ncbi:MAG: glycoside hydrolase family 15 protein [Jatrophihabitans sp.]
MTKRSSAAHRDDLGFAAIGDYGVLGDGHSVALVALDGSVDWWAIPRLDSTPSFAALLDPVRGGRIELRPVDPDASVTRRYLPHTNIVETTYTCDSGQARVTDCLNSGNAGALPWTELARRIDGVNGSIELMFVVAPGDGLASWEPWCELDQRGPVLHAGDVTMAVRASACVELRVDHAQVSARFSITGGDRIVLAVLASEAEPLYLAGVDSIDARLDLTAANWRHWSTQVQWEGHGREQIVRSALALKLLMMARTGAIAAAATTSLPERIGADKNWDYRFSWIRDAALTIDALSACGLQEEVHAAVAWLLRTIRENGPDVHVMYGLDGTVPTGSRHAHVPGYKNSQPVMIGNDAASQVQLGVYGDLFGTVADWVFGGHVLDVATARELADLADQCADTWRHNDAGIWELQTNRPYVSSKMNSWRALDAAARLADAGHIAGSATRWRHEAELVRAWVEEHGWSETKRAYIFYAGSDDLDASVLLGAKFGFDVGPRMASTIDAITTELGTGALLYRYTGVQAEEQTFIACAYWRVQALVHVGQIKEAEKLMAELDDVASPLGLLAEMSAPGSAELVGNFPQALSHLALINAAAALRAARAPHPSTTDDGSEPR